jgi:ribosomal protein S18 acetylase RimI-like enzyme
MELQTVGLQKSHFREDFDSGQEVLDEYLKKRANQDIKKKLAVCFVLTENKDSKDRVKGYYTLSNTGIPRELIPEKFQKKFPKSYNTIPATLLGRLARDKSCKRKGMGEKLLIDALFRSYLASKQLGSFAVVVDPIDEMAIAFYESYGFKMLPDSGKMFLSMATVKQLFI